MYTWISKNCWLVFNLPQCPNPGIFRGRSRYQMKFWTKNELKVKRRAHADIKTKMFGLRFRGILSVHCTLHIYSYFVYDIYEPNLWYLSIYSNFGTHEFRHKQFRTTRIPNSTGKLMPISRFLCTVLFCILCVIFSI